jgi:CRISPR-associated endonuclease/helicase Cas3
VGLDEREVMSTAAAFIAHHRKSDGETQALSAHLLAVAAQASCFAAKVGLPLQGELIGLLHDLGKYSDEFQAYLKSALGLLNQDDDAEFVDASGLKGKVDHSTAGAQLVWEELAKGGQLGQIVGQVLALCIASHHSGLIDCLTSNVSSLGEDAFGKRMKKAAERTHLQEVLAKADMPIVSRARELLSDIAISKALQEVMANIVRDAPAKTDKSIVAQLQFGFLVRFLFSCLIDADRIDTADFEKPQAKMLRLQGRYAGWDVLISRLEDHLARLDPRLPIDLLRHDISSHCRDGASRNKGVYSLTVPTGGGKTFASLRFALHHASVHSMERVIYLIPFTSIIDQNAKEVRNILEPEGTLPGTVVLEHHCNLTPEEQTWRGKMLAQNWDAPVVFTTNVQFLEAFFGGGTRGARRMHQLANAVLIFDEIQTLPVNCVHLFNNAINFLVERCGSTVVLCTATQPLLDQVDPEKGAIRIPNGNELMPDVKALFDDLKRVEVLNRRKPGGWTNEEIATLALEEVKLAGSCLVVVNTKEAARALYRLCQTARDACIYHLSTHMCPAHRRLVLRRIRSRLDPNGTRQVLCFSTQLIEAGVDVDFGSVIRFAAGLDSIAQAAGRCNRNGRRATGRVHVVNPRGENLGRLLDIRVGRDIAERVMDDFEESPERFGGNRIGPETMKWYYQNYFFARSGSMDYSVSAQSLGHSDTLLNLLSVNSMAVAEHGRRHGQAPNFYYRQSFMAAGRAFKAIDAPTRGIVVPYGDAGKAVINDLCAAFLPDKEFELLRLAQQYSVNVFPHVLKRLISVGAVREIQEGTGILYLDSRYYSKHFGLSESPVEDMEVLYA